MKQYYKVQTRPEAFKLAGDLLNTDYKRDDESTANAGYNIYRSITDGVWNGNDRICDLNCRLEVNIGSESINIWIEAGEMQGEEIKVEATATGSVERRTWNTYADFRKDYRFFLSSGKRYDSDEAHFETIIKALRMIDAPGTRTETVRTGMRIAFIYQP